MHIKLRFKLRFIWAVKLKIEIPTKYARFRWNIMTSNLGYTARE